MNNSNYIFEYQIVKKLGSGNEGDIFLVKDKTDTFIIKKFNDRTRFDMMEPHKAGYNSRIVNASGSSIEHYAKNVNNIQFGLYPLEVLKDPKGLIYGVKYNYENLYKIPLKLFRAHEDLAKSIFSLFCKEQAFLMQNCGLAIGDSSLSNYMITRKGEIRYTDYGVMIFPINDFRALEEGYLVKAFIDILMIYTGYQTDGLKQQSLNNTLPFVFDPRLDKIALSYCWIKNILKHVRSKDSKIFLQPDFYLYWSDKYSVNSITSKKYFIEYLLREDFNRLKCKVKMYIKRVL